MLQYLFYVSCEVFLTDIFDCFGLQVGDLTGKVGLYMMYKDVKSVQRSAEDESSAAADTVHYIEVLSL